MNRHNIRKTSWWMTAALLLTGCGGGGGGGGGGTGGVPDPGDGGDPAPPPIDGIDRGGAAIGPIDGFGSVIVNGVRFDTDNAVIVVDGAAASLSDLEVGQVVVVVGTFDEDGLNGEAERVEFDEAAEGPIEAGSIDLAAGTFRVLGQTVQVNGTTLFDDSIQPQGLDGLADGDVVEVSGLPDADGRIVATRIELKILGVDDEFEVTGMVTSLDPGAMTFQINDLTVDYSAAQLDDFPGGVPSDGDLVEAEGRQFGPAGELLATRVELRDELEGDNLAEDGDEFEIEGIITTFRSSSDFDIAGIRVITDGSTQFERGSAADLALNVRIEVKGEFEGANTVRAREIEFEEEGDLRISGNVEAVDSGTGTFRVMGLTIATTPGTSFEDDLEDMQIFGLADLRVGDYVETRGFDDAGVYTAQQIERDEPDDSEIRGIASNVSEPTLSVLGISVSTDAQTDFEDLDDTPIAAAAFFAAAEGRLVSVKGIWTGSELIADEAELE